MGSKPFPGLLHCLGTLKWFGTDILVLQRADCSVQQILDSKKPHPGDEYKDMMLKCFSVSSEGLHRIHNMVGRGGIVFTLVHGDLKPANLLFVARQGLICIADFELSFRFLEGGAYQAIGDDSFQAPEAYLTNIIGPKADVFAFCHCLLLFIIFLFDTEGGAVERFLEAVREEGGEDLERLWGVSIESGIRVVKLLEVVDQELRSLKDLTASYRGWAAALAVVSDVLHQIDPKERICSTQLMTRLSQALLEQD
jgi:serine/threonine protein kinase